MNNQQKFNKSDRHTPSRPEVQRNGGTMFVDRQQAFEYTRETRSYLRKQWEGAKSSLQRSHKDTN